MQISANIGNSVCALYEDQGVVCPPKLKADLFTTGCVDNIDHNPSSRTAKDSFHGTSISLTQHPTENETGTDRGAVVINPNLPKQKGMSDLPQAYTHIDPLVKQTRDQYVPLSHGVGKPGTDQLEEAISSEYDWLVAVEDLLQKEQLEVGDNLTWSAYHAASQPQFVRPRAITSLLPLFSENAHSLAMIQHSMKVIKEAVNHLNCGQTPIITMDQPLFAIGKQIQWTKPDDYGEDKYVVMMGGLHIEMAVLRMVGHWLNNSGWANALVQASVTTSGKAEAVIKASHVTRSRYCHQVSACALHLLMRNAYTAYLHSEANEHLDFNAWRDLQSQTCPQFKFWSTALNLELMLMIFVRSVRTGDFALYVQVLSQVAPWMFALDQNNYARWLPIHIRDMMVLEHKHPAVFAEFQAGKFVAQKSSHVFSCIALDQNHEQENEVIKGEGGAVGLTENPAALRRWMIAGPEIARIVKEFEATFLVQESSDVRHHEQVPSVQRNFAKDVESLVNIIEDLGNPFLEDSRELLVLDTKEIMPECVIKSVMSAGQVGQSQYESFMVDRLQMCTTAITDTIHRNNLTLFGMRQPSQYKAQSKLASLKSDCNLFARLYIGCQARDGNLEDFFKHENQACPPALSVMGKLRVTTKSDLLPCLEVSTSDCPEVDMKILDGAVVVNMLPPGKCRTFQEYATEVFQPYIVQQSQAVKRVDIVWDCYMPNSLKKCTRESRGAGTRQRVSPNTVIPANWKSFLRSDENKAALFVLLSRTIGDLTIEGVQVVSTLNNDVISSTPVDRSGIAPCNHEEADTRMILHSADGQKSGLSRIMIRTVDTDVLVLAIANVQKIGIEELWLAFGVGKHFRYIPAHQIASTLGFNMSVALPFFHALTGCDTVSAFAGRGKPTAFEVWRTYPEVTEVFQALSDVPDQISDEQFEAIEQFVVLMYSRTCPFKKVNQARQTIFAQGNRTIENIPPTQAALWQHAKRAAYQAGHVWGQSCIQLQELPIPGEWGWQTSADGWTPLWTTLPEASKSCSELIHCGCKKACRGQCKCYKASLQCTHLCYCAGNCHQD